MEEQFFNFIQKRDFMKYVWASWGNFPRQFSSVENSNHLKTRHIRGYGRAVTFSTTHVAWSPVDATYTLTTKSFEISISRG